MIATVLFLGAFVTGLGLAVYAMLHGVERSRFPSERRPSAIFNAPTAAAFGIVLGATGYILVTRSTLGIVLVVFIGLVLASAATAGSVALMAWWALPHSGMHTEDDGLQGQLAVVTEPISLEARGEIVFNADGIRRTLAALSIQEAEIPRDAEVVIDMIEDGVAHVELWSTVEQRL